MKCLNCGYSNEDREKHCLKCGSVLDTRGISTENFIETSPVADNSKNRDRKSIWISIGVNTLILVTGIGATALSNHIIYTGAIAYGGIYLIIGIFKLLKSYF